MATRTLAVHSGRPHPEPPQKWQLLPKLTLLLAHSGCFWPLPSLPTRPHSSSRLCSDVQVLPRCTPLRWLRSGGPSPASAWDGAGTRPGTGGVGTQLARRGRSFFFNGRAQVDSASQRPGEEHPEQTEAALKAHRAAPTPRWFLFATASLKSSRIKIKLTELKPFSGVDSP